jgi:hydroxymethylpyrimidine pyrophosphatase-like HAD family hydrolase
MKKRVYLIDIDGTVCDDIKNEDSHLYPNAKPYEGSKEEINKLYDEGHTIVYWTARGSRTNINWYDLTKLQLDEWGAKHHELRVDKPYYDLFIDDKNMRIEEI